MAPNTARAGAEDLYSHVGGPSSIGAAGAGGAAVLGGGGGRTVARDGEGRAGVGGAWVLGNCDARAACMAAPISRERLLRRSTTEAER